VIYNIYYKKLLWKFATTIFCYILYNIINVGVNYLKMPPTK